MAERSIHVALLRGINVGGRHRLPMKVLAALFAEAGCEDVRTHLQSGNVVFRAEPALARRAAAQVAEAIAERLDFRAPVVTRTAEELQALLARNPFQSESADVRALHVAFLRDEPEAARVAGLDPDRSPPDAFAVVGREIFLHCPRGLARTKLTNDWFDARLDTVSTVRSWPTVLALAAMASA